MDQQGSYEVALETAKSLHGDLKRLKSEKGDHEPIPKARVGASLGIILGTGLGLTPELGLAPTLEVGLGIVQQLTIKAAIMVTYRACVHGPQMDPCPEGE